ncbi:MAG: hypothetical protein IH987_07455 [Planctomycetes bacterium]|nr:hypothetical protein [Planctomycetota bacterium]
MTRPIAISARILCAVGALLAIPSSAAPVDEGRSTPEELRVVTHGRLILEFDPTVLDTLQWQFVANNPEWTDEAFPEETRMAIFPIRATSTLQAVTLDSSDAVSFIGRVVTRGAIAIDNAGSRVVLGNFVLGPNTRGDWHLVSTLGQESRKGVRFDIEQVTFELGIEPHALRLTGDLILTSDSASRLGMPESFDIFLGVIRLEARLDPPAVPSENGAFSAAKNRAIADGPLEGAKGDRDDTNSAARGVIGPDVIVGDVQSAKRWARVDGLTAYSIGTVSCNVGDEGLDWFATTRFHPVIAQNMYRLKEDRFEQIGMSWVKHGFTAGNGTICSDVEVCAFDPTGQHLGVDCSDVYGTSLNGWQANLGPRYQVNPTTGGFAFPWSAPPVAQDIDRRIQVRDEDLDPDLNAGALYFIEGHYVTADDAADGNQDNNASYRRITIVEPFENFFSPVIVFTESTARTKPAILAWQDQDPNVEVVLIDVPDDRRFILASKTSAQPDGTWHYEYAIHNLNSNRSGQSFSVPIPAGVTITNIGFHDVDSHSGSPFSSDDWTFTLEDGVLTWSTDTVDMNPTANALRWGMLYNFRFDADTAPQPGQGALGLFRDGDPPSMIVDIPVPRPPVTLVGSDPPDGAIDARQPHELNHRGVLFGWQDVRISYSESVADIAIEDIIIDLIPDSVPSPEVVKLIDDNGSLHVFLNRPIPPGHWTCLSLTGTVGRTCLGYLPGDANGDGLSTAGDVLTLVDAVNEVPDRQLPEYSADIDRSGDVTGNDVMRLIDLLNGAASFDTWITRSLPDTNSIAPGR